MLLRTSLSAFGAILLASGAFAQQDAIGKIQTATAVKDAGTYHMATGTWTRANSPIAQLHGDVLYDNTCTIGFYFGLSAGESMVDSGRLPSPSSPTSATSVTGSSINYLIDGLNIGYCTGEATIDANMAVYQCYDPCADATLLIADFAGTVLGLPGTGAGTGSLGCWNVTVDLSASTTGFTIFADCDGTYDGVASLDNFGWSYEQVTAPLSGVNGGPFIAGDPFGLFTGTACTYGDGTFWSGNVLPGTGLGSDDVFETDLNGLFGGCWFFGGYLSGNPYSSFGIQITGDAAGAPTVTGTQYCFGDGLGTACPCLNNNDGSNGSAGCANGSSTGGASLDATGTPSVGGGVVLTTTGVQPTQPGLYFRADNAVNAGAGILFGDGLRCAGGALVRLGVVVSSPAGVATSTGDPLAGLIAGDIRRFQFWYRNPAGSPCGNSFNLSNGYEITVL